MDWPCAWIVVAHCPRECCTCSYPDCSSLILVLPSFIHCSKFCWPCIKAWTCCSTELILASWPSSAWIWDVNCSTDAESWAFTLSCKRCSTSSNFCWTCWLGGQTPDDKPLKFDHGSGPLCQGSALLELGAAGMTPSRICCFVFCVATRSLVREGGATSRTFVMVVHPCWRLVWGRSGTWLRMATWSLWWWRARPSPSWFTPARRPPSSRRMQRNSWSLGRAERVGPDQIMKLSLWLGARAFFWMLKIPRKFQLVGNLSS